MGLIFVLSLCVGSFLNVLIYRLPRGMGFVKGRSFCPKCRHKISWFDNVPLISFILLKGRCRFCRKAISWRYPLVELLTGVIFCLSYLNHLSILSYLLFAGLIVIFFIDLEHFIIPDKIVFSLIFLFLFRFPSPFWSYLLSAGVATVFFLLLHLITRGRGMGLGDVKLACLIGLALGYPLSLVAFYLAFLTGALTGAILVLVKKAKLGKPIPFGPFLSAATVVSLLWGREIINLANRLLF